MTGKYSFTLKSSNNKTGKIPVTTSPKQTCPSTCPHKETTCYAGLGPLGIHWSKLSKGERGISYSKLLAEVNALPKGTLWRHNQAGDLVPDPDRPYLIHGVSLYDMMDANTGKKGFTYTHYKMFYHNDKGKEINSYHNQEWVQASNEEGFTINLSADTFNEADKYMKLGIAPVVVTLPWDWDISPYKTASNNTVIVCPAVYQDDVTCETCKLCQVGTRKTIVGFPAHGSRKKQFKQGEL